MTGSKIKFSDSKGSVLQKLQDYWNERSSRQKSILVGAFLAAFLAVSAFSWMVSRPSMAMLYSGLDPSTAGEVIAGIERAGVAHEVRGGSIYVDASQRDRLRMELAGEGLPATGAAGYELLDGMSGFGTTSQMFDAAYWRAKEGELARTILALPNVKSARVHLAVSQNRGLRRDQPATASVTLTTTNGSISRAQAQSLKYMLSSAVPGLAHDSVTVIDTERGVVAAEEDASGLERATEMKRNVERILEPHVGPGNAIVELNLDLVTETELLTEQRFDPQERAMISQLVEETSDQSTAGGAETVTAASNLPDGNNASGDQSQSSRSENRQQSNYEVSKSVREVSRQPGAVKRLSVAVLVNGVVSENTSGEAELIPRTAPELEVLRELVASAVGFDPARGDQLTVKSLPFAQLGTDGTLAERGGWLERIELNALIKLALIGLFAVAIAALILRPILRNRQNEREDTALLDNSAPAGTALEQRGASDNAVIEPPNSAAGYDATLIGSQVPGKAQLSLPPADPVARLRGMMKDRQQESMKILSGWIDEKEKAQ
ncbi:flagellar basal-body MS-ring/collar protein FliF [Paracoccus tegillarcae]|uniref:Flagellar M-ring protein n=1 Tax=Paracoccus tegillarcae TaxID=1529068 RepID=A0A2K9EK39_9RHOB|nr:flagellar basal-body MS-ring/collar protein FliF [Paracoccus tegillarcae]AUH33757.1 flagellar M-ring protein FliF [Paracoccus tegillarcae]